MLEKIVDYENRLLQDRRRLNELIVECRAGNIDAVVGMKMDELQREIEYMERQAAALRMELECQKHQTQHAWQSQQPEQAQRIQQQPEQAQRIQQQPEQPRQQNVPVQQATTQAAMTDAAGQKKTDFEKTIGKSIMGICASVLIFISLISFTVLILPYLSSVVKMMLMYAVSIAFAVTGVLLLKKDRQNKLFLSIAGCGMGALYISLFVTDFYFKAISDMTLYVCIFGWAVCVCVLSRLQSDVFLVIGQIGTALSLLLGVCLCGTSRDTDKMLFLAIYGTLTEVVYYISHLKKVYGRNMINHIFWCVCLFLLMLGANTHYMSGTWQGIAAGVLLVAVSCLLIVWSMTRLSTEGTGESSFGVFNSIYFLTAYAVFGHWFGLHIVVLVAAILTLAALELRITKKKHMGKIIFQCTLFLVVFGIAMYLGWMREFISVVPFAVICLIYGFVRKDTVYKIAGMIYAVWFVSMPMDCRIKLVLGLALASCVIGLFVHFAEQYRTWMKAAAYPLLLVLLIETVPDIMREYAADRNELRELVVLAILAATNISIMKIPVLHSKIQTEEKERAILIETGIIQIVLMLQSLFQIGAAALTPFYLPQLLLGILIFGANSYQFLKQYKTAGAGIYVATKLLVLVITALHFARTPDFLISLAIFGLALLCIALGFGAERRICRDFKAVRLYGLILALVGMLKLVLIDIHYDHTLMRTAGFFVSGLICFAISFVYHIVDKEISRDIWKNEGRKEEDKNDCS